MIQSFEKNDPGTQRDTQKKCMICGKQFKIGRKEHQCKRCFRAVCSDCGKEKSMVFMQGFIQQPHRNCKLCVQETKGIKQYINANKIVFGSMSIVGEKWVKKLDKAYSSTRNQGKKNKSFSREVFNRMWDSYNYSMRQFIGFLTFNSSQQDIYALVFAVLNSLENAFPKQSLQCLAYLSIFLLCFCTPDKATALGLQLLELKNMVTDSQGLLSAYLKALGLSQQDKIRSYVKQISNRFVTLLSINLTHVNSSIYLLQKVINRKKIDEVYMFFTLSLDVIKDQILKQKHDFKYYNLLLVRKCNSNSASSKYRQASSVKSSYFIKDILAESSNMNLTSHQDRGFNLNQKQQNLSYNGGQINFQEPKPMKKNTQYQQFQKVFQKNEFVLKVQNQDLSPNDSLSMLSMLQQLKGLQRPAAQPSDGNQILAMLNGIVSRKTQQSQGKLFNNFTQYSGVISPIRLSPNQAQLNSMNLCLSCQEYKTHIESLKKELQQYSKLAETIDFYKQENLQLKEKLKKYDRQTSSRQTPVSHDLDLLISQKRELQGQLKKLKQNLAQFQNKQKVYQQVLSKQQQAKQVIKRLEAEIRTLRSQNEQFSSTTKMLTNRLQNYALQSMKTQKQTSLKQNSAESSTSQEKITELLKQSVKQKNTQIEQLTKKNKLLVYQLQQASRSGRDGKDQAALKQKVSKLQSQRSTLLSKITNLSDMLLQEESQKLKLSQDNFFLKQLLRDNKIRYQ